MPASFMTTAGNGSIQGLALVPRRQRVEEATRRAFGEAVPGLLLLLLLVFRGMYVEATRHVFAVLHPCIPQFPGLAWVAHQGGRDPEAPESIDAHFFTAASTKLYQPARFLQARPAVALQPCMYTCICVGTSAVHMHPASCTCQGCSVRSAAPTAWWSALPASSGATAGMGSSQALGHVLGGQGVRHMACSAGLGRPPPSVITIEYDPEDIETFIKVSGP